jgi:hypothetical protein
MGLFSCLLHLPRRPSWRMISSPSRRSNKRSASRRNTRLCSRSGMIPTRGPHMNRFRLATSATLAGVLLAAGCASPCGCGGGVFQRMSMFRARRLCPCESCSSGCGGCGGGGVPAMPASQVVGDGPILEPPGLPHAAAPPPAQVAPAPTTLGVPSGPPGIGAPSAPPTIGVPSGPPTLGVPSGPSAVPAPERFTPVPAPVTPAEPSSRSSSRSQR